MTIADVITEIGYRMDDPDLYTYKDSGTNTNYTGRAKRALARAINTLLDSKEYTLQDVFGLVTHTAITPTADSTYGGYKFDIVTSPNRLYTVYGLEKKFEYSEPSLLSDNSWAFTDGNIVRYTIIGRKLVFVANTTLGTSKVIVITINDVDWNAKITTDAEWTISNFLSYSFISKVTDLAVQQLIAERNSLVQ